MSQRTPSQTPTPKGTGPNAIRPQGTAMDRGDYGPWNQRLVRRQPVRCEPSIYYAGTGIWSTNRGITRGNPMSYSAPRHARVTDEAYPIESAILTQAASRSHPQNNLYLPDLVFANAIHGSNC